MRGYSFIKHKQINTACISVLDWLESDVAKERRCTQLQISQGMNQGFKDSSILTHKCTHTSTDNLLRVRPNSYHCSCT